MNLLLGWVTTTDLLRAHGTLYAREDVCDDRLVTQKGAVLRDT